jgi:type II secretory pathway pseudopilin PulG
MKDFPSQRKGKKALGQNKILGVRIGGFTLIETLIIVAILAILIIIFLFFYQRHLMRSRDATRKSDLDRIRVAFEEYYNDHRCYPSVFYLNDCGGTALSPYLKEIPCDPLTRQPYLYQSYNGDYCQGYRLLARLEIDTDNDIYAVGCDPVEGCAGEDGHGYNWGISMGDGMSSNIWQTGGFGLEGEEEVAFFCLPVYGGGYTCDDITLRERSEYFLDGEEDASCDGFISLESCNEKCVSEGELDPGVACICKRIEGEENEYSGCQ